VKSALRMIAGHGGKDPGAIARGDPNTSADDLNERDLNIDAVLSFNDVALREFVPHDVTIVVIGADDPRDGNETLLAKIKAANDVGPDQLLIELHHNVGGAGSGAQLWYSQNAKATPGDETWLVLPHLARELGFLTGEPVPQISSDRSRFGKLGILDDTTCTAVLVELRNLASINDPAHPLDAKTWAYSAGGAIARACGAYFGWPRTAVSAAQTPIGGFAPQDPRALEAFMRAACPTALVDVAQLARLYVEVGLAAGIRADVAIAQAVHETGRFTFTGTAKADWNNYAGVGVTGPQAVQKFDTMLAGVKAHLYHLRWYDRPGHEGFADCSIDVDPRHDAYKKADAPRGSGPHANNAHIVRDLGGRWAPSSEYGLRIAGILDELNAFVGAWAPAADTTDKLAHAKQIASRAAAEIAAL
jgi:N-acetylmuramoyl-L-alanine amidase